MPLRVRLDLATNGSIAPPSPEQLHAVACTLLDRDDQHRSSFKPFTLCASHAMTGGWAIELGLLDDGLASRLDQRLHEQRGIIRFGRDELPVRQATITQQSTWDELADRADSHRHITLRFVTPTFFRRGANVNLLPVASAVFGHWRQRWTHLTGAAPHCPFDDRQIHVINLDVTTQRITYRRQHLTGLVGTVTYDLGDLPPEQRAAMDALAKLAPYAGCGSRTTAGFGVTQLTRPAPRTKPARSTQLASSSRPRS